VDFNQNELTVSASAYRSKDRNGGEVTSSIKVDAPKTKAGRRTIPMTDAVRRALSLHKINQAAERAKAGGAWENNELVFCTALGKYLEYRNVTRLYEARRERADLPKLTFHCLRHTCATRLHAAGADAKTIQTLMGHTDYALTANLYTHVRYEELQKAVDLLDETA
jgi:integrase